MKSHWTLAVLLSSALLVGCGDKAADNTANLEEQAAAPAPEAGVADEVRPVDAPPAASGVSSSRDGSTAVRESSRPPAARATAGTPPTRPSAAPERSVAAAPAAPAPPRWREVTVPAGTALPLELLTALSSETAQVETPVRARLRNALVVDGHTALPAGAVLNGQVIDVDRAGRIQGRSRLIFRFDEVEVDAGREELRTNPIAFEGEATKGEDATKVGAGAVGGAIIGGILGGGDGAAKGAAIGGAAGAGAVLATRGREVKLAAGSDIAATLATPFTVQAPVR